ncbi:MAG: triose-phosphate isomerase [Legionellales bacterium]|jgi:triosephosphate isomerase (TIM)|nr:triose-phosphate isomerase [Legionellales bacterium]
MSRSPVVVGNWKMHGSNAFIEGFFNKFSASDLATEVAVLPPFVYLQLAQNMLGSTKVKLGAQNISEHHSGAFTGETSSTMLQDFACEYVLVGHSERRTLYNENNLEVANKFFAALKSGIKPILCVGETLGARENNETFKVIESQCNAIFKHDDFNEYCTQEFLIAYEPVWAIGTGKVPGIDQIQDVHRFIRSSLAKFNNEIAKSTRILYGGSLNSGNCKNIFNCPDVDGGLVGGASLDPSTFREVVELCNKSYLQYM